MSKQAERVVDTGVTVLPHCNEDTNAAATLKMRSGRLVAEAETIHHSIDYANANATATKSEHEEVRLVAETAAALHSNGIAFAESTKFEHADGRLVVGAAAALDLDEDTSIAAKNLGKDTHTAATCNLSEDTHK